MPRILVLGPGFADLWPPVAAARNLDEMAPRQVAGLADHGFDVDTYAAAVRVNAHIAGLGTRRSAAGRATVVVVGAGFTGIEVATEMPSKLKHAGVPGPHRVILIDPNPVV